MSWTTVMVTAVVADFSFCLPSCSSPSAAAAMEDEAAVARRYSSAFLPFVLLLLLLLLFQIAAGALHCRLLFCFYCHSHSRSRFHFHGVARAVRAQQRVPGAPVAVRAPATLRRRMHHYLRLPRPSRHTSRAACVDFSSQLHLLLHYRTL